MVCISPSTNIHCIPSSSFCLASLSSTRTQQQVNLKLIWARNHTQQQEERGPCSAPAHAAGTQGLWYEGWKRINTPAKTLLQRFLLAQAMQESSDKMWVSLQYTLLWPHKHRLVHSTEKATLYIHPTNTKNICFHSKWVAGSAEDPSVPTDSIVRDQL